jgi:AcrR family transcriptional regulator
VTGKRSTKVLERAELQRDRILNAAQRCFIEHGFHAASMANIADTAQMSAGLIYRYFENKNAIILAIIERQLNDKRNSIATLQSDANFATLIVDLFSRWLNGDPELMNPALFLEMSAQASRDPQIARALLCADHISGEDMDDWLKRRAALQSRQPDDVDIQARTLALQCFIEGLAIRVVRQPNLDLKVLAASVALFVPTLMTFRD